MTDAGFVFAAYGVIFGGLGLYALTLARRLRAARHQADDDGEGR
jgi:CcmD family protein